MNLTSAAQSPLAKRFPDVNFLVYHSGLVPDQLEGPCVPDRNEGIDSLVNSVIENGVAHANVYPELGSTWRYLMRDPDPSFRTYGPRTRREFLNLLKWGA